MSTMTLERVNCGHCGRFIAAASGDVYAPWGGAADTEPPEPVDLCGGCTEKGYRETLSRLLRDGIPPRDHRGYWQPPAYWYRARSVARTMFRHGLAERPVRHERVRYETSGVRKVRYCRHCSRPERHPGHGAWEEARRVGVAWCGRFQWSHAINVGTFRVEEWCACGWTTGPVAPGPENLTSYLYPGKLMRDHLAEVLAVPDA